MADQQYIVTIQRQFGSLGRPIAKKMSEILPMYCCGVRGELFCENFFFEDFFAAEIRQKKRAAKPISETQPVLRIMYLLK